MYHLKTIILKHRLLIFCHLQKKIVSNLHVGLKHIGHIKCQNLNLLTLANNYIMCHFEIGLETTINVY